MQALQRVSLIPCHCCIRFTNTKGTHSPGGSCLAPSPPCFGAATLCVVPCYGVAAACYGVALLQVMELLAASRRMANLNWQGRHPFYPKASLSCAMLFNYKSLTALGYQDIMLHLAPYVRTALAYHGRPLLRPLQRQSSRAQCYALASADSPSLIYVRLIECLPPF